MNLWIAKGRRKARPLGRKQAQYNVTFKDRVLKETSIVVQLDLGVNMVT